MNTFVDQAAGEHTAGAPLALAAVDQQITLGRKNRIGMIVQFYQYTVPRPGRNI